MPARPSPPMQPPQRRRPSPWTLFGYRHGASTASFSRGGGGGHTAVSSALLYTALAAICALSFGIRMFAVVRWEAVIHEYDPYFNYRATKLLASEGLGALMNWQDDRSWYPLGRIVGGTLYPGLLLVANTMLWAAGAVHPAVNVRTVCVFVAPVFAPLTVLATYLLVKAVLEGGFCEERLQQQQAQQQLQHDAGGGGNSRGGICVAAGIGAKTGDVMINAVAAAGSTSHHLVDRGGNGGGAADTADIRSSIKGGSGGGDSMDSHLRRRVGSVRTTGPALAPQSSSSSGISPTIMGSRPTSPAHTSTSTSRTHHPLDDDAVHATPASPPDASFTLDPTATALLAAALMAINPSYISRSVGGSFDNEGVAIFALVAVFYAWVRAVQSGALAWGAATALAFFFMAGSWGGYVFVLNVIPIHAAVLVVAGRYSPRLYVAYTSFYVLGGMLAMQVRDETISNY